MKKLIFPIICITFILIALVGWLGAPELQAEEEQAEEVLENDPYLQACKKSVVIERDLMRKAWNDNMVTLTEQEKPTSEMVDEAFESMRTYYCWLDYLCEAVLYSSVTLSADKLQYWKNFNEDPAMRLTSEHIDDMPGCSDAEDVEIPGTKLKFMTNCTIASSTQTINVGYRSFNECREIAEKEKDIALMGVQKMLKENSVKQKSRALTNKLQSLLTKMHGMESHMELLKQKIFKFDALLPCFIKKCD